MVSKTRDSASINSAVAPTPSSYNGAGQQQEEIPGCINFPPGIKDMQKYDQNCRTPSTDVSSPFTADETQQELNHSQFNAGVYSVPSFKAQGDMSLRVQEAQAAAKLQGQEMAVINKIQGDAIMPVMPVHKLQSVKVVDPPAPRGVEGHLAQLETMLKREAWVTDYMLVRMNKINTVLQLLVAVLPVSMAVSLSFAHDVAKEDGALKHSITLIFVTGHLIAVYLLNHLKLPYKICDAERMLKVTEGLLNRVTLAQSRPNVKNMEELLLDIESKIDSLTKDYCFQPPKWAYKIFSKQCDDDQMID